MASVRITLSFDWSGEQKGVVHSTLEFDSGPEATPEVRNNDVVASDRPIKTSDVAASRERDVHDAVRRAAIGDVIEIDESRCTKTVDGGWQCINGTGFPTGGGSQFVLGHDGSFHRFDWNEAEHRYVRASVSSPPAPSTGRAT